MNANGRAKANNLSGVGVPTARLPSPYTDESIAARAALERMDGALDWHRVAAEAAAWASAVRERPAPFWALDSLLAEYPLSSHEGRAMMRLAEALLRVADDDTAILLTADQLGRARFDAEGHGGVIVARVLALAQSLLPEDDPSHAGLLRRIGAVGSSRVDLQACKLEYSIVSPK